MKRREGADPANGPGGGILALALVGESEDPARLGMARDLVLLGTHKDGEAFWLCALWGSDLHRSDFVHVAGPCRC